MKYSKPKSKGLLTWISTLLLISFGLTPAAIAEDSEKRMIAERTKTGFFEIKESARIAVVTAKKTGIDQTVVVTFRDANNDVVARRRGAIGDDRVPFIAEVTASDLLDINQPLLRAVVRVDPIGEVDEDVECPSVVSAESDAGMFLTWVSQGCSCGGSGQTGVFAECIGAPDDITP